ncbi:hypothetical protein, partial [Nocardia sp. NPDC052112]|uniref:hypothetical protein n=1 Tax=Nocardia sp. NPDC052112 TaxID=3155646 RepID=UPI00341A4580
RTATRSPRISTDPMPRTHQPTTHETTGKPTRGATLCAAPLRDLARAHRLRATAHPRREHGSAHGQVLAVGKHLAGG